MLVKIVRLEGMEMECVRVRVCVCACCEKRGRESEQIRDKQRDRNRQTDRQTDLTAWQCELLQVRSKHRIYSISVEIVRLKWMERE